MSTEHPDQPALPERDPALSRLQRKQERIRAELERNRTGGHRVPTWTLAALLALVLFAWFLVAVTA